MKRPAFSLLELIVVIALLGVLSGVVTLSLPGRVDPHLAWRDVVGRASDSAIRYQVEVRAFHDSVGRFTAFPSGMVLSDSGRLVALELRRAR